MQGLKVLITLILVAGLAYFAYTWGRSIGRQEQAGGPGQAGAREVSQTEEERGMQQTVAAETGGTATSGQVRLEGVSSVILTIVNGDVEAAQGDLPAGVVELSWSYEGQKDKPDPALEKLSQTLAGGTLTVVDWRKPNVGMLKGRNINLKLKLTHGPGITKLAAEHANGDFSYDGGAATQINLANGTLHLQGAPAGGLWGTVANGKIEAALLLTSGDSSLKVANGSIDLALRGGSSVAVKASTVTGDVSGPAWLACQRRQVTGNEGSGTLGAGAAKLKLDVVNGEIKLR